jgi:hypothetical protein
MPAAEMQRASGNRDRFHVRVSSSLLRIPAFNHRFSDQCACSRAVIELNWLKTASSFDAGVHSVNALTEELCHIRFSVQLSANSRELG